MKLVNILGFLLRQPKRLPEPCPICRRPMKREGLIRFCPDGHRFRDRRARPYTEERILNEGDQHGEI